MRVSGYDQTIVNISRVERRVRRGKILFQILKGWSDHIQMVKRPFFTNFTT